MFKRWLTTLQANISQVYLITFAIYLASVTINTTTFYPYYPHRVATVIQLLAALVMLGIIVLGVELTTWQLIGEVALLCLVVVVTLISSSNYLVTTVLLVMAARTVNFRRIVKVYLWVVGGILLIAFLAAMTGVIKNITFATDDGLRQSFGVVYTTDFASHLFYLVCAYLYLQARRFRPIAILPALVALGVIVIFTHTMTNTIGLVVLIVGYLCYIYRRQLRQWRFCSVGLRYSYWALPLAATIIIWLTAIFNANNRFLNLLNQWLSTRLSLGYNGLLAYGVRLLGQPWIPMNGWGGDRSQSFTDGVGSLTYFFIDSSFLNMLILNGALLTIVIVAGFTLFLWWRTRQRDYLLPVIFVAIAICSAFDQHFLEVTYNVFLLAPFAVLPRYKFALEPHPFHVHRWYSRRKGLADGKVD
ncbi:polysaccharide biosynthesis protein [Lactiplantibacillus plajomi]|uniref:Polysaccharide biosynthesis protein n=1 Tax=Lactiplantibacillus plajomi TaxID=1457217 RepID=A0ABV6K561_9LACO|nr:polysaccharide biosynthesis protein [Lactiplantibacillus plajomi]